MVSFYRVRWCPCCNTELRALQAVKAEFESLKANVVVLSPDTCLTACGFPANAGSAIQPKTFDDWSERLRARRCMERSVKWAHLISHFAYLTSRGAGRDGCVSAVDRGVAVGTSSAVRSA